MGDRTVSTRAYAAAFNLKGGMQEKRVSSTDTQTHRSLGTIFGPFGSPLSWLPRFSLELLLVSRLCLFLGWCCRWAT